MPVKLNDFTSKIVQFFNKNKKNTWLFVIGIVGIIIIGLSDVLFTADSKTKTEADEVDVSQYVEVLEKKTVKILSSIDGAGRVKVMITAENSHTQEFAVNENKSSDTKNENSDEKIQSQSEIVIIEGSSGKDTALVTKVVEPKIRGVLVLCEGADNIQISENITLAVKTVLGVSANKICVLKLK